MPRNMPMCHGQLNSTDFRSLAPSAGVYGGGGGGPPPGCAFATTVSTAARPVASATRTEADPILKAMVVPPIPKMLLLVRIELDQSGLNSIVVAFGSVIVRMNPSGLPFRAGK